MMQLLKVILVAVLLLGVLVGCTMPATDAGKVAKAAAGIADFDLPDGYVPDFTADLLAYSVVAYKPVDGHGHLYLIQSGNTGDGKSLESAINEMHPGDHDPQSRMTVLESRPVTVRGQQTTLIISEGINAEGAVYRQAMASFTGKSGPALVVYSELLEGWNASTVESFLASLR